MFEVLKSHKDLMFFIILSSFLVGEIDPIIYIFLVVLCLSFLIFGRSSLWRYLRHPFAVISLILPILIYGTIKSVEVSAAIMMFLSVMKYTEIKSLRDRLNFYSFVFLYMAISVILSDQILYLIYCYFIVYHIFKSLIEIKKIQIRALKYRKILSLSLIFTVITYFIIPQLSLGNLMKYRPKKALGGYGTGISPGSFNEIVKNNEIYFTFSPEESIESIGGYWRAEAFEMTDGRSWSNRYDKKDAIDIVDKNKVIGTINIINKTKFPIIRNYDSVPYSSSFKLKRNDSFEYRRPKSIKRYDLVREEEKITHVSRSSLTIPKSVLNSKLYKEITSLMTGKEDLDVKKKINLLTKYFTSLKLSYSLEVEQSKENNMDHFLYDQKIGYCEHFSSAFALALRISGIPANVIGGFYGGDLNKFGNYLVVRGSNAHAWVEYYDGKLWKKYDPVGRITTNANLPQNEYAALDGGSNASFFRKRFDFIIFDYLEDLYLNINSSFFSYDLDKQKEIYLFIKVKWRQLIDFIKSLSIVNVLLSFITLLTILSLIMYALIPDKLILYLAGNKANCGGSIENVFKNINLDDMQSREFIYLFNRKNYSKNHSVPFFRYLRLKRRMFWKLLKN